jgi:hypothetical protein
MSYVQDVFPAGQLAANGAWKLQGGRLEHSLSFAFLDSSYCISSRRFCANVVPSLWLDRAESPGAARRQPVSGAATATWDERRFRGWTQHVVRRTRRVLRPQSRRDGITAYAFEPEPRLFVPSAGGQQFQSLHLFPLLIWRFLFDVSSELISTHCQSGPACCARARN